MTKIRMFALLVVVAHWLVAVVHLFIAAEVLPPPNSVSALGITLITAGHLLVALVLSKIADKLSGAILLLFFLAAFAADAYEHFLHASGNNVFMVAASVWTAPFDVSVFALAALEILGCVLAVRLLGGRTPRQEFAPIAPAAGRRVSDASNGKTANPGPQAQLSGC